MKENSLQEKGEKKFVIFPVYKVFPKYSAIFFEFKNPLSALIKINGELSLFPSNWDVKYRTPKQLSANSGDKFQSAKRGIQLWGHYSKPVIAEKLNFLLKWRFSTITITGPFESGGVSVDGKSLWKAKARNKK